MPAEWNMPLKQSIQWNKVTLLTQVVWLVHVTYFVDNGPKVNWFCVYWTDCPCAFEQGADGEGGGGKFRPHHLKRLYFHDFVYLPWTRRPSDPPPPPCGILCDLFAVSRCADPKYTPPVTITNRTHTSTHTRQDIKPSPLIETRVFPPARKASSCRTYTHSFPSPPPSHFIPSDRPPGSLRLSLRHSRTFTSSCSLFESLLSIYESLYLSVCVSIYWSIYLCPSPSFPLSQAWSPQGRKRTGGLRARSQTLLHLDFITNRPARHGRRIITEKKMKERDWGLKGL